MGGPRRSAPAPGSNALEYPTLAVANGGRRKIMTWWRPWSDPLGHGKLHKPSSLTGTGDDLIAYAVEKPPRQRRAPFVGHDLHHRHPPLPKGIGGAQIHSASSVKIARDLCSQWAYLFTWAKWPGSLCPIPKSPGWSGLPCRSPTPALQPYPKPGHSRPCGRSAA